MAKAAYHPPRQGIVGMIIDSVLMLVLVFCALKAPEWIAEWRAAEEATEEATVTEEAAPAVASAETSAAVVTWAELGQNAAMQAGWERLGKDPAAAKAIIDNKFDYTVDVVKLLFVVALIVFYFWYMLTRSAKEYKDVISEKFD
ncbi:MAG: hypothetical protein ACT4NU_08620 [Chromatiales bacterium]